MRSNPGATSAAINAASITRLPAPHIGSTRPTAPLSARAISGQPARSRIAAARFSFSGAAPCGPRYPRRCRLSPDRSMASVATSRSICRFSCTSGVATSTDGRPPVRSRNWSTTASLTFSAAYCVCVIADRPVVQSTASVPSAARCALQSTPRTPSYNASGVGAANCAIGSKHAIRYARPQARTIRVLERAGALDAGAQRFDVGGAERRELARPRGRPCRPAR